MPNPVHLIDLCRMKDIFNKNRLRLKSWPTTVDFLSAILFSTLNILRAFNIRIKTEVHLSLLSILNSKLWKKDLIQNMRFSILAVFATTMNGEFEIGYFQQTNCFLVQSTEINSTPAQESMTLFLDRIKPVLRSPRRKFKNHLWQKWRKVSEIWMIKHEKLALRGCDFPKTFQFDIMDLTEFEYWDLTDRMKCKVIN